MDRTLSPMNPRPGPNIATQKETYCEMYLAALAFNGMRRAALMLAAERRESSSHD
jgi:hypothetical protein